MARMTRREAREQTLTRRQIRREKYTVRPLTLVAVTR